MKGLQGDGSGVGAETSGKVLALRNCKASHEQGSSLPLARRGARLFGSVLDSGSQAQHPWSTGEGLPGASLQH